MLKIRFEFLIADVEIQRKPSDKVSAVSLASKI